MPDGTTQSGMNALLRKDPPLLLRAGTLLPGSYGTQRVWAGVMAHDEGLTSVFARVPGDGVDGVMTRIFVVVAVSVVAVTLGWASGAHYLLTTHSATRVAAMAPSTAPPAVEAPRAPWAVSLPAPPAADTEATIVPAVPQLPVTLLIGVFPILGFVLYHSRRGQKSEVGSRNG